MQIKFWQIFRFICNYHFVCPCGYEADALQLELPAGKIKYFHIIDCEGMDKQQAYWLARCYLEFKNEDDKHYILADEIVQNLKEYK